VIEYLTDGIGRRVGKLVDGVVEKRWVYRDSLRPIAELDASGNVVARFVYADGVGAQDDAVRTIFARIGALAGADLTGGSSSVEAFLAGPTNPDYMEKGGRLYRLVADQLGSVRLVVDVETGAIEQRLDYDEFGAVLADTSPGFQVFGFAGGLHDGDTGLVRFGAREYDLAVGRWMTRDPVAFAGDQGNLYLYSTGDPVNITDSRGLGPYCDACRACLAASSAAFARCVAAAKHPRAILPCNLIRIGCVPGCIAAVVTEGCLLPQANTAPPPSGCEGRTGSQEGGGGHGAL
jgi:RHS repeat-associated protein